MSDWPNRPTPEQCTACAPVVGYGGRPGYACWYPQMGGYAGRCIVTPDANGCFEALVWHDGEFPFDGESRPGVPPNHLHHCMAEQFIKFGEFVLSVIPRDLEDSEDA